MATNVIMLRGEEWVGVYATNARGAYKTPMIFDGTLDEVLRWRRLIAENSRRELTAEEKREYYALCEASPSCLIKDPHGS